MKPLGFHRLYHRELEKTFYWYQNEAGRERARHFSETVLQALQKIEENPRLSHFDLSGYRRINLPIYPYHILFEELDEESKILLFRHNSQHPSKGIKEL